MTKTEAKKLINKGFYEFMENTFPEYTEILEDGGRMIYTKFEDGEVWEFEYHQGRQEICTLRYDHKMDGVVEVLELYIKRLQKQYKVK